MEDNIVGFRITTNILLSEDIIKNCNLNELLCEMESKITDSIETNFVAKVNGGKGEFIKEK